MLLDQDRRFHNTQKRGAIKSELFLWKARVIPFIISKERREFYFTFFFRSQFLLRALVSEFRKSLRKLFPIQPTLREKYPNTKFFLVRTFPHSDWIRTDTSYLSVFSPSAGKYGPEKTPYLDTFHGVLVSVNPEEQPAALQADSEDANYCHMSWVENISGRFNQERNIRGGKGFNRDRTLQRWGSLNDYLSTFTWNPKLTRTGLRFHFGQKFHFWLRKWELLFTLFYFQTRWTIFQFEI